MRLFTSGVWLLGGLLPFSSVTHSRDADPTEDFCSLRSHMMAQKDDILYIAGGVMRYLREYQYYDGPNSVLRSLNISESFKTSLDSVHYVQTEEIPGRIPGVSDAALFPTESGFDLTFGRWNPYNMTIYGRRDPPIERKKWQYEIVTQRWTDAGITRRNWFRANTSMIVSSAMTAWIPSLKRGFLFGGAFVAVNEKTWRNVTAFEDHSGLITYNQATNTWTNETTPLGGMSDGGLVHVTTTTDEVLIQFGGTSGLYTQVRNLSDINIYSIKQSKWYTQHLPPDAEVPGARFAFCTALKAASDGSSYQIYIMGGLEAGASADPMEARSTGAIWVLSIPSFEWVQLSSKSKTTVADPKGRVSPRCQAIGEHYIFYYGGNRADYYTDSITCDERANAAFLFDVNTSTWTDEFTPNKGTYEIPQEVIKLIGGSKDGGSTKKAPTNGWSDPALETIMALNAPRKPGPTVGAIRKPGPNVGAIAGGTVGGVAAVVLGLLVAVVLRSRRQRGPQLPPIPVGLASTGHDTLGEGDIPAELMTHNEPIWGRVWASDLQSGVVERGVGPDFETGMR